MFWFSRHRIKREFWWPPSKCFLLSLINPGPHGTQVQPSDVFNSWVHRHRRLELRIVYVFIWVYYSWHIHIDSCGELQEGTTVRGGKSLILYLLQISAFLNPQVLLALIKIVNICKSLRTQKTSEPSKMSPNPILWLSVTRLNFCLCLEYRSGSSLCHLWKDYKGQL